MPVTYLDPFHYLVSEDSGGGETCIPNTMILVFDLGLFGGFDDTVVIPIYSLNIISIDWGDGIITTINDSYKPSHIYAEVGIYIVKITGSVGIFSFNKYARDSMYNLIEVKQLGTGWDDLDQAFYGCTELKKVTVTECDDITNLSYYSYNIFAVCGKLTEFNGILDFGNEYSIYKENPISYLFWDCINLKYIGGIHAPHAKYAHYMLQTSSSEMSLICMGELTISSEFDTDNLFVDCNYLVAPNLAEQQDILNGISYINPNPCPAE